MKSKLIAAVFLFVGLAIAVAWYLGDPPGAPAPAPAAAPNPVAASTQAQDAEVAQADVVGADADAEVPESLFRTDASPEQADVRYVTIQVWDRVEGAAAAEAEVFVMRGGDADWEAAKGPFAQHWSSVAERKGRQFRADAEGRVEVPGFVRDSVVVAKGNGTYAFKWVGEVAEDGHVEVLTLQPDESVTIRVVDEQGRPVAGAAVGVVERFTVLDSLEELEARTALFEGWVRDMRQWMRDKPGAAGADLKLEGLQEGLRVARRDRAAARQAAARRAQAGLDEPEPVTRFEVRARRLTDENGLAVVDHLQLYRGGGKGEKAASGGKAGKGAKGGKGGKGAKGGKAGRGGKGAGRGATKDGAKVAGRGGKGAGRGAKKVAKDGGKKSEWGKAQVEPVFEAALLMPLTTPVTKEISLDELPDGVIELQKPPTAALALRTVDRDGRPFTHPVHGKLAMQGDVTSEWSQVMLRKEQNERAIVFPHVGLGLSFTADCRLDDDDFRWRAGELRGPVTAGERVEVDLVVAPDAGMLFAQLVDGDSQPIGGLKPSFLINAVSGRLEGEGVITDEEGRFHLPYKVRADQVPPYRLEVRLDDAVPTRGIALPLAQLPEAMVTDLGRLTIDAFGEVVRGVVVNDAGTPIAAANVQLQRQRPVGEDGALRFVDESFVRAEADESGKFQLFGELEPGQYRLRVEAKDHFGSFVEIAGAGSSCRPQLQRKSRLVGTVIAPEWMVRPRVRVELTPVAVVTSDGETAQPRQDQIHDHEGKTYAYFDWLRPGTYDLAFRLQGYPDAFLRVDSIVLEPGQTGLHPRLRDLDLGAYIYRFEVYPVDQNGQPVEVDRPQLAKITRPGGEQQFVGLVMKGSFGEVYSTQPQLEVRPMMTGYLAETQVLSAGRSELVFQQIPPVELVFAGLSNLAGDLTTRVILERMELDGRPEQLEAFDGMSKRIAGWYARAKFSSALLDSSDMATLGVTAGGPHKVLLRLRSGKTRPETVEVGVIDVRVAAGSEPQRMAISYDVDVLQQAIQAARQRAQESAQGGK